MREASILLAYREPEKPLRFYYPDAHSTEIFHFADFNKEAILKLAMAEGPRPSSFTFHATAAQDLPTQEAQEALLSGAIKALKKSEGAKVVLSRFVEKSTALTPLDILDRLDALYPKATVYCFSHPDAGTWFGATPERLFSLSHGRIKIDSLAGTRPWEARDSFTSKEKEEQAIVTEAITTKLEAIVSLNQIEVGPQNIKKAGDLAHLHNEISASLMDPLAISALLDSLPPTPAVGGKPQSWALNFIRDHELYNRRYYTGYLGWACAEREEASFWVNLRCAEWLKGNKLAVYVGGGITAESDVKSEWLETEHKAQTILKALDE